MDDPGAELAEFFAALDPETIFRSIALALAENRCDNTKDHTAVMAVAAAYFDFIDPFALEDTELKLEKGK